MLNQDLIHHIKKQRWESGSTWEFDWYIDVMFCHAMAYGNNPIKIGYTQPILDDEFLNTEHHAHRLEGFENFLSDKEKVSELITKQNSIINRAKKLLEILKKDYSQLDYDNYYQIQYDLSLLMASVSTIFDKLIEIRADEISTKTGIPVETISNYIIESSSVTALNKSNEELIYTYNNNKKYFDEHFNQNKPLSNELIRALDLHTEKYGWLNSGERGKQPWKTEDFLKQLSNLLSSTKAENKDVSESIKVELTDIIKININDNVASDIQIELDFMFQKHLMQVFQINYDENILGALTFEEIQEGIKNPSKLIEYKKTRINTHRLAYPSDNEVLIRYLTNEEFSDIKKLISTPTHKNMKIEGRSACQGIAEGIVRVVRNMSDLDKFEEGQILVAEKTQPSYVMAMKKAKAIVTDIGGITSHAAIVSREFNIPCIVATINATKQLKDGDFVRVDAFSGEVIKLR